MTTFLVVLAVVLLAGLWFGTARARFRRRRLLLDRGRRVHGTARLERRRRGERLVVRYHDGAATRAAVLDRRVVAEGGVTVVHVPGDRRHEVLVGDGADPQRWHRAFPVRGA